MIEVFSILVALLVGWATPQPAWAAYLTAQIKSFIARKMRKES